MTTAVEFKNVDIIFGDRSAEALAMARDGADRSDILKKTGAVLGATGANLTVKEGEISVLMGLSGSGKSTLVNLMLRFWEFDEGQILLGGQDIRDYAQEDVRRSDGFLEELELPLQYLQYLLGHGAGLLHGRASGGDAVQRLPLVLHVALDRLNQIRNQVVAPLQLNVNLRPGVLHLVPAPHEAIVEPHDGDKQKRQYAENDINPHLTSPRSRPPPCARRVRDTKTACTERLTQVCNNRTQRSAGLGRADASL